MNTQQENIIVDSCQYTPVYLVQNTGAIQGRPYIVTQANIEETKPVSDNLKRFYESSGILENNFVNNAPSVSKPRILKKQESKLVGNNLKLASFLLPKLSQENNLSKQCLPVNNVVLKQVVPGNGLNTLPKVEVVSANVMNAAPQMEIVSPNVEIITSNVLNNPPNVELMTANLVNKVPKVEIVNGNVVNSAPKVELVTTNVVNCSTVSKVEVDRKIVKLKNFPNALRTPPRDRPKRIRDDTTNTNPKKHTSVQLLKLGETYHSLNQLSDDQMKMVNQALKIFSNPEKASDEPTYDPVTNTRFIYKVVSPKDLTVVGKNKLKKEPKKVAEEPEAPTEVKITRSGRKVKFPKQIVEDTPPKPRKKNCSVVSCFQCSTEFISLYRLQKHYENHPTHIPARVHSNLFHCLLAIIRSGSEEDRTNIFTQQLEQLIVKLRSLLPCLLKKIDGAEGKPCTINDDIGRLFGMNPGQYNLNMNALSCVKDKDGHCRHNRPPNKQKRKPLHSDLNKPSQIWLSKHNEEMANTDQESEDCARINAVDKWPTAKKRIRNSKQQKTLKSVVKRKKMKMNPECPEASSVIQLEDLANYITPDDRNAVIQSVVDNGEMKLPSESTEQSIVFELDDLAKYLTPNNGNAILKPVIQHTKKKSASESTEASGVIELEDLADYITPNNQNEISIQPKSLSLLDDIDIVSEMTECTTAIPSPNSEKRSTVTAHPRKQRSTKHPLKSPNNQSAIHMQPKSLTLLDIEVEGESCIQPSPVSGNQSDAKEPVQPKVTKLKKAKGAHTQFHSAHFDIRSSPIKTSSTFHKFQINPEKLGNYEVQIIRPLDLDNSVKETRVHPLEKLEPELQQQEIVTQPSEAEMTLPTTGPDTEPQIVNDSEDLHSIFKDDIIALTCKDSNDMPSDLSFEATKDWICNELNEIIEKSDDNFMKTNSLDESFIKSSLIEPALLHLKDDSVDKLCDNAVSNELNTNNHLTENDDNRLLSNQGSSVLNFLDSLGSECLSYPETEIRNNAVDFQLDLFSFSNT